MSSWTGIVADFLRTAAMMSFAAAIVVCLPGICHSSEAAEREPEVEQRDRAGKAGAPASCPDSRFESTACAAGDRLSTIDFAGDFRYRFEAIERDGAARRTRSRIRARANIESKVRPRLRLGAGLATGGSSPVSSTQTLGDGGSKKDIALDLAYVGWMVADGLEVLAGKFRNPLHVVPSQTLLWDDEWRPEGMGITYRHERGFANLIGVWMESDSAEPAREFSVAGHAGIHRDIDDNRVTVGVGYADFGTSGKQVFFDGDAAFAGNTRDCGVAEDPGSCRYRYDYRVLEAFAAADATVRGADVRVYGHYVRNLDAPAYSTGWTGGLRIQTTVRNESISFDYFYRDVGADSVLGQLTDSDFGGGGTDARGHVFKTGWQVNKQCTLSLTVFDNVVSGDPTAALDYHRVQLNADFKY